MKNILQLSSAADITAWGNYFLKVASPTISIDPVTGLDRVAIVKDLQILPEATTVIISTALYLIDANGDPLNAYIRASDKNIFPIEVKITANNESYINLQNMQVSSISGLTAGVDYLLPADCESITNLSGLPQTVSHLPEFEAYRIIAKSNAIDLFALMTNAIVQSTKI